MAITLLANTVSHPSGLGPLPGSWNPLLETLVKAIDHFCGELRLFKITFNPEGDRCADDVWKDAKIIFPSAARVHSEIKKLEATSGPVKWKQLDGWIEKAKDDFRRKMNMSCNLMAKIGIKPSVMAVADEQAIHEKVRKSPIGQMQDYLVGPHWLASMEKLDLVRCNSPADSCGIPIGYFRPIVDKLVDQIVGKWKIMKEVGTLNDFERYWGPKPISERIRLLTEKFPDLPRYPHAAVYAWAQGSEGAKGDFTNAWLNREDLSQDGVLPKLLQIRQAFHPAMFRAVDGSSALWGLWCGALKQCGVKGTILFPPDSYEISMQDMISGNEAQSLSDFNQVRPIIGLYQLQAQLRIYTFLLSCLEDLLGSSIPDEEIGCLSNDIGSDEYPSVLAQCARDACGRAPNSIDLEYLNSIVKASLDEALHDLWQVRQSPDLWIERMSGIPGSHPGKTANFLLAKIGRIDLYHTLSLLLDAMPENGWCTAQSGPAASTLPENCEAFKRLISVHVAFQCMLNEVLCQLSRITWSPTECSSGTFSKLFDLLKGNDTSLRVMGIFGVLRVIDQEINKIKTREIIPFSVMRALDDLSVLSVCLQETSKHYHFATNILDYSFTFSELVTTWKERHRPWMSVAENTIKAMSKRDNNKLNILINANEPLLSRHNRFWTDVDNYMRASQDLDTKSVIDAIQEFAPISRIDALRSLVDFPQDCVPPSEPTQTQVRRGKKRGKVRPSTQVFKVPVSPILKRSLAPLITVRPPARDYPFWRALLSNRSELHWSDFCKAMEGIGFKITTQVGVAHQFKGDLGLIVFHKPHEKTSNKVSRLYAHSQWLERLEQRFKIVLEEP